MQKQIGKVGAIHREVKGKACVSCGSHQYQLRLTPAADPGSMTLHAHCIQCHRQHATKDNFGDILWM